MRGAWNLLAPASAAKREGEESDGGGGMSATLLYGSPAPGLAEIPRGAVQVSPLIPGAQDLAELADASVDAGKSVV